MAVVDKFEREHKQPKTQPTHVICHWSVLHGDNGNTSLLQFDTRGSEVREKPEKQSQTLQLTRESAKELFEILKSEFKF
jgi:hypothetical protein